VRGKRSALAMFSFLQTLKPEKGLDPDLPALPATTPAAALAYYAANAAQPGPLILLSDLMDDGWQTGLNRLAGKGFEVTLLHILAPDELDPAFEGDFKLLDSETGREVEISANFDTLSRYRRLLADWQEDWRQFCAARGMHYLPASTHETLEDLLFAGLPQQGVLR
jgi:hypothetical protein